MTYLPTSLVGKTVIMRSLSEDDLEQLYALETDESVKQYVGGPVKKRREEWIAGMSRSLGQSRQPLCVTAKATGDFAGRASLSYPGLPLEESELQVLIARRYWRSGFGYEVSELLISTAFDRLGARSVVAVVHPENTASRKMCEKLGFVFDAIKRYPAGQERWDHEHHILKLPSKHHGPRRFPQLMPK
ncbi:MAG: GNAT family N-acetyltransferase [Rhodoplanes sp.]